MQLTHLLFVDDVLIFYYGSVKDFNTLDDILKLFSKATGMNINFEKSTVTTHLLNEDEEQEIWTLFPFNIERLEEGLKYLGFFFKTQ